MDRFDRYRMELDDFTVDNSAVRPTGQEMFDAMTPAEQDEAFGPVAALVREGKVALQELLTTSSQATDEDFITQKPLKRLT